MSTDQQVKPRCANQSITDESARPGTLKSKVGCDAIDEPWTNNAAGLPSDVPTYFSQRKRRTSPLCVQCSLPVTASLIVFSKRFKQIVGLCPRFAPNRLIECQKCVVILRLQIRRELGFA